MHLAQPIRILVVDYHVVVRNGITGILQSNPDFEVISYTGSGEEALRLSQQVRPDVILIDVDLPDENSGIEAIRKLHGKTSQTHIVVLTNNLAEAAVHKALQAGAVSYLLKNISTEELVHAIQHAYQGQSTLSPEVTQILVRSMGNPNLIEHNLTRREHQVLELIAQGQTNREIADRLNISLSTVQFHVSNILNKLGAHNRIEAATIAIRLELRSHSV